MAIKGAIIDCDGTILETLDLWVEAFAQVMADEGHPNQLELARSAHFTNLWDECAFFVERTGSDDTPEEFYRKVCHVLKDSYATKAVPFPDAEPFLKRLADASIPMAIASTTRPEIIELALERFDLAHYFEAIVSANDLHRGKEVPDVYEKALDILGTPKEATPVIDDALFGVTSASRARFPVVGLVRSGSAEEREAMAPLCVQVVSSLAEVDLAAL